MLKRSNGSGWQWMYLPCTYLRRKSIQFSPLSMMLAVGFSLIPLNRLRNFPSIPVMLSVSQECYIILLNLFLEGERLLYNFLFIKIY